MKKALKYLWLPLILLALVAVLGVACAGSEGPIGPAGPTGTQGPEGDPGPAGPAGISTGTLSGTLTNSATTGGVAGVDIAVSPGVSGLSIQTASDGTYSATLPVGAFTLTFTKTGFASATKSISVIAGGTVTANATLTPDSPVVVNAGANQTGNPGGTLTLTATVSTFDDSSVTAYSWTSTKGVSAAIATPAAASTSVTLGTFAAYKSALLGNLEIQNRNEVVAINPHSLSAAETVTFTVTVTTGTGTYSDSIDVVTQLPFVWNGGIADVPTGLPVLLNGKTGSPTYDWSLTIRPPSSAAVLNDNTTRNPYFTPDVAGKYTVTDSVGGNTIDVYAGTWAGAISGIGTDGLPNSVNPVNCTICHNGGIAPDMFTPWRASGHAEIFTVNLNTSTHYGDSCFSCHTVGYNTDAANGGIDDATNYAAFLAAGIINSPNPDNWATVVNNYPSVARLANIQCENCHGPNVGSTTNALHNNGTFDRERISLSSDVCGSCHGEPARHGRFQQWEESGHANFELAIDEGLSTSCARCHSAQGFLTWLPRLASGNSGSLLDADITWTADTVQPQTCATCHDPHSLGTTSGEPNDVVLRVQDNTSLLPSGFKALGVGNGAICMTCHNTRNGARNDFTYASTTPANSMDDRAPHTAAQADVLMGQNAFFVATGQRSAHSYIQDTCSNCHMQKTDPPAEFSYQLSGTNHAFKADVAICADCHAEITAEAVQKVTHAELEEMKSAIEKAIIKEINAQITAGNNVTLVRAGASNADVVISTTGAVTGVALTEASGRQAMNITVSGTTYNNVRLGTPSTTGGTPTSTGTSVGSGTDSLLTSNPGQIIAKAGWNFFLIEGDDSAGIHNPSFTNMVIAASLSQLAAL